ncbi:MAG: hypothetical protein WCO69_04475 [Candidatus Omnitrophota bacterium]
MHNKILHSITKDRDLRWKFVTLLIALILCVVFWGFAHSEQVALKVSLDRQAALALQKPKPKPAPAAAVLYNDHLMGTIINPDGSVAIIDTKMYKVGDEVGNRKVTEILERDVTLCEKALPDKCEHLTLEK